MTYTWTIQVNSRFKNCSDMSGGLGQISAIVPYSSHNTTMKTNFEYAKQKMSLEVLLSAAQYSSIIVAGSSCVSSQCFFRLLHVLEQVDILCGLSLMASDFSSVIPPGRSSPRLPLQRLTLIR